MWTGFPQHGQNPHNDMRGAPPQCHVLCQALYLFHHIESPSSIFPPRGPCCCPIYTGGNRGPEKERKLPKFALLTSPEAEI